jgi:hypothetical protein
MIMSKAKSLAIKAGVWIDHKKAVVVLISYKGEETRRIRSEADETRTPARGSRSKNKYGPNDFVAEDRRERRFVAHLNKFYDEVVVCLRDADAILILGPGEAKSEFKQRFSAQKVHGRIAELQTADRMTDRQIAASVRRHFALKPERQMKSTKSRKLRSMSPDPGKVPHDLGGEA